MTVNGTNQAILSFGNKICFSTHCISNFISIEILHNEPLPIRQAFMQIQVLFKNQIFTTYMFFNMFANYLRNSEIISMILNKQTNT